MATDRRSDVSWVWYAPRTPDCAPLDEAAYPSAEFNGRSIPWPDWVCRAPDGGVHIDARCSRIDLHLAKPPRRRLEYTWTCNFGVRLLAQTWLSRIEDLVDPQYMFSGDVVAHGRRIAGWSTLHARSAPPLLSSEGWSKTCPICGDVYSTLQGRPSFTDPAARSMPLIANRAGIFIRKDVFAEREIPTPAGAFEPKVVWLEEPPT